VVLLPIEQRLHECARYRFEAGQPQALWRSFAVYPKNGTLVTVGRLEQGFLRDATDSKNGASVVVGQPDQG
jgi:hypothetical protein